MNFIIFDVWGNLLPIAKRLQDEGNKVLIGKIEDIGKTFLPGEKVKKEDPELKKRRLSQYTGLLKIFPADELLEQMKRIKNPKNFFVLPEGNWCFSYTQEAEKMGFAGLLPREEDRKMEVNRDDAKEIIREHYPDVKVKEYKEFKTAKEGIEFLQNQEENSFVLKSLGEGGETIVPKNEDAKLNNEQLINVLETESKDYESNGFVLEQKIINGVEATPQAVFYDGELVFNDLDIETKTLGASEKGPNVGMGSNLIIRSQPEDKINQIAFPKYIMDIGKERSRHGNMYIIDLAIMFDVHDNTPYFLEYCGNRFGWDSFPTELAMSGDIDGKRIATPYFERLLKKENPLAVQYGSALRLFNLNQDKERYPEPNLVVSISEEAEPDIYLYDVKKDREIVSVGYQQDLGVSTGVSDDLEESISKCYDYVEGIGFKDIFYRPKDDFLSTTYPQAILNRLNYLQDNGWIEL